MDSQELIFFPETPDKLQHMKDMAQRCKCLCLEKMGKHPLFSVSCLSQRDKKKLVMAVLAMMNEPEDDIIKDFNDLFSEELFSGDYTRYGISEKTQPAESPAIEEWKIDPLEVSAEYSRKFPDNTEVSI